MQEEHCIIVGGSHAAAQALATLKTNKWPGKITLVSADGYLPYHRPPLSKTYLSGVKHIDQILIRPANFYEGDQIDVRLNTRVTSIDRSARRIHLDDHSDLAYSKLILVTGARVRRITTPGHNLPGVFYLRDITDVDHIREHLPEARNAVIVGGGYIGLETASALRALGLNVTIVEALPRVLARVTTEEISAFYTRIHQEEGVKVVTDAGVTAFKGSRNVQSVELASGEEIPADLVIVGIGVIPETDLAEEAGLEVDNGIVVDEYARTSDPDILAAGDCTSHYNPIYDRRLRLESVQNATDQAKVAANTVCGNLAPYNALPWFWSDQYDLKLQIAGLSQGFDQVVIRGSTTSGRSFAAFYLQQGRLLAVDAVNRPKEYMVCRKALTQHGVALTPDIGQLADESVNLQEIF